MNKKPQVCTNRKYRLMSTSITDLYSTQSWGISTALCVPSGSIEIGSSSAIVKLLLLSTGSRRRLVASSSPSDLQQRRPDDRKCWASNVVRSGDVEWLTVNDVDWECLRFGINGKKMKKVTSSRLTSKWCVYVSNHTNIICNKILTDFYTPHTCILTTVHDLRKSSNRQNLLQTVYLCATGHSMYSSGKIAMFTNITVYLLSLYAN